MFQGSTRLEIGKMPDCSSATIQEWVARCSRLPREAGGGIRATESLAPGGVAPSTEFTF